MGGTGGDPEQPGQQVPYDSADKACKDDKQKFVRVGIAIEVELIEIDDPFTDCFCHLDGEECADEVENR